MHHLPNLATRVFDTPLLIAPQKLEVILAVLAPRLGLEAPSVAAAATPDRTPKKPYEVTPDGIAVIPVEGTLVHKTYGLEALSGLRSYTDIQNEVEDAATDPAIKGILLEFDSPGGEVAGVFDLADTIAAARSTKPIYAVANNDAFSAAYLLASGAERIYASRTSGLGSVGVIVSHLDVSGNDEKMGYKYTIIHAGARKADFNSHAPLSEDARNVLATEVDRTYGMLISAVAQNRGMSEAAVRQTEAGLYFGSDAVNVKLADVLGTRQDALNDLRNATASRTTLIQTGGKPNMQEETVQTASEPTIDLEAIRGEARRQGYAEAREIVELCALAGMPDRAAELLTRNATATDARQALLTARAAEDAADIRTHVMPDTGTNVKPSLENNPVVRAVQQMTATAKGVN
jgi:signal peptide peptidase SppA